MYSIATRAAIRRAALAPVSRTLVVAKRYSSTEHGNDPEVRAQSSYSASEYPLTPFQVLEREKQRNLRNEQHKTSTPIRNAPGWNLYLASESEADVKVSPTSLCLIVLALTPGFSNARRTAQT